MEEDARKWTALEPENPTPWGELATALHANGAPWPGVLEALKARREKMSAGQQSKDGWLETFRIQVAQGDFAAAEAVAQAAWDAVPSTEGRIAHFTPALQLMLVRREIGDSDGAARTAEDFLARSTAWTAETSRDLALGVVFVHAAFAAGKISREEFVARRTRAIEAIQSSLVAEGKTNDPYAKSLTWVLAYASSVQTAEDAVEALTALPASLPLPPPGVRGSDTSLVIGVTFELAGKFAEAKPYLEQAARSCHRLDNPLVYPLALDWVGHNRAALGDVAGAQQAFHRVLEIWPDPKPRSIHVEQVRERLKALEMPPVNRPKM